MSRNRNGTDVDNRLIAEAMKLTKARSKREAVELVELALRELVNRRRRRNVLDLVGQDLIARDDAGLTPVIYQEILQGAASPERFDKLRTYFGTLPFLLPRHPVETCAAAAALYVRCRGLGFTTPRSGLSVCC